MARGVSARSIRLGLICGLVGCARAGTGFTAAGDAEWIDAAVEAPPLVEVPADAARIDDPGPVGSADSWGPPEVPWPPSALPPLVVETGPFAVPPGQEVFVCTYSAVAVDEDLAVVGLQGTQKAHGHHVTLFYSMTHRSAGQGDCFDIMDAQYPQVGPAPLEHPYSVPPGSAIRVPKGAQLIVSSHYINPRPESPLQGDDSVTLHLADPAAVKALLDNYHFNVLEFEIPAKAAGEVTADCTIDMELQVVAFTGHMHAKGVHYRLEVVDAAGRTVKTLLDTPWSPEMEFSGPGKQYPVEAPLVLPAGTRLRQRCEWANPSAAVVAFPTEMCSVQMVYFPGQGQKFCPDVIAVPRTADGR